MLVMRPLEIEKVAPPIKNVPEVPVAPDILDASRYLTKLSVSQTSTLSAVLQTEAVAILSVGT